MEALLAEKDLALNQAQTDLSGAQGEVALWHRRLEENRKQVEGKSNIFTFVSWCMCVGLFPNLCPPLSVFWAELEKKVAEATSAADTLKKSLDAEVT